MISRFLLCMMLAASVYTVSGSNAFADNADNAHNIAVLVKTEQKSGPNASADIGALEKIEQKIKYLEEKENLDEVGKRELEGARKKLEEDRFKKLKEDRDSKIKKEKTEEEARKEKEKQEEEGRKKGLDESREGFIGPKRPTKSENLRMKAAQLAEEIAKKEIITNSSILPDSTIFTPDMVPTIRDCMLYGYKKNQKSSSSDAETRKCERYVTPKDQEAFNQEAERIMAAG